MEQPKINTRSRLIPKLSLLPPKVQVTVSNTQHSATAWKVTTASTTDTLRETTATSTIGVQREITKECLPKFDPSNIKTSFKFYIYDLPPMFNTDILKCMTGNDFVYCYNLNFCGMGEELMTYSGSKQTYTNPEVERLSQGLKTKFHNQFNSQTKDNIERERTPRSYSMSVRNTHMFALEVIIHYKLLHSRYRTLDPSKADIFYIPFYSGLMCQCDSQTTPDLVQKLFSHLHTHPYFQNGKPHFSTLGKIEREQASALCPILRHQESSNITFIGIEKESNPSWSNNPYTFGKSILVAPYPAYNHFIDTMQESKLSEYDRRLQNLNESQFRLQVPSLDERNVLLFLGCGTRRSNYFRARIMDQFPIQTDDDYDEYINANKVTKVDQIMLKTNECALKHRYTTIPWMMKSIFCLQPPGDSPTRKSFYDSILSGCIPVTFKLMFPTKLPFSDKLNYDDFTYTIDEKLISRYNKTVIEIVNSIPKEKVNFLHNNILKVAKWFQYSMPDGGPQQDDDAMTLILDKLRRIHNLP